MSKVIKGILHPFQAVDYLLHETPPLKAIPRRLVRYLINEMYDPSGIHQCRSPKDTQYVLWLHHIYRQLNNVPGHVIELGTGPGTNAILFSHLINLYGDKYNRHYYGFDTFGGYPEEDIKSTSNVDPEAWQGLHIESVRQTIQQCEAAETTTLIEGDLKQTLPEFIDTYSDSEKTPGNLNVALVYIDCNSYNATKAGLEALHKYISPGGIICADELKQGGETRALKEFCEENGLPFNRGKSPISWAPYTKIE